MAPSQFEMIFVKNPDRHFEVCPLRNSLSLPQPHVQALFLDDFQMVAGWEKTEPISEGVRVSFRPPY